MINNKIYGTKHDCSTYALGNFISALVHVESRQTEIKTFNTAERIRTQTADVYYQQTTKHVGYGEK